MEESSLADEIRNGLKRLLHACFFTLPDEEEEEEDSEMRVLRNGSYVRGDEETDHFGHEALQAGRSRHEHCNEAHRSFEGDRQ